MKKKKICVLGAFGYYNNNEILGINTIIYGAKSEHPIIFPNNSNLSFTHIVIKYIFSSE